MHPAKLVLTTLAAATLLASAVSSASAGWLSISERAFDIKWRELNLFNEAGGGIIDCQMTLLGTFHSRTIRKTRSFLIGVVDHAVVGEPPRTQSECSGAAMTILTATLPWHLRYDSFSGTLPRITLVKAQLVGVAFRLLLIPDGVTCLIQTDTTTPMRVNAEIIESGQSGAVIPEGRIRADDATCEFLGYDINFQGFGSLENRRGGLLFIRLI
jgi:hypothetical protein